MLLNQKLNPATLENESDKQKLMILLRTFFEVHKGWHIQYNIVSRETLLEAKKHPDQYRDLVVRVAGYSAFFTALSPDAQDDIIARHPTYAVISSARLRRRRAKSFTSSISSLLSFEI